MGVGFGTCALVFFCLLLDISGPWFSHLNKDQKHQLQKLLWGHLWEAECWALGRAPYPVHPSLTCCELAAGTLPCRWLRVEHAVGAAMPHGEEEALLTP